MSSGTRYEDFLVMLIIRDITLTDLLHCLLAEQADTGLAVVPLERPDHKTPPPGEACKAGPAGHCWW